MFKKHKNFSVVHSNGVYINKILIQASPRELSPAPSFWKLSENHHIAQSTIFLLFRAQGFIDSRLWRQKWTDIRLPYVNIILKPRRGLHGYIIDM